VAFLIDKPVTITRYNPVTAWRDHIASPVSGWPRQTHRRHTPCRPARHAPDGVSCNNATACPMSLDWPAAKIKSNGLPKASVMAWSLVVKPPFERPKASASALLPAAPAAQAWTRAMVLSIKTLCKSGCWRQPSCKPCHAPRLHHLENRLNTEFHLPSEAGNKRHCPPLRKTHKTALRKQRQVSNAPT
jgi:hypothetical protein